MFFGRHGLLDAERDLGARFKVDLEIAVDLAAATASDDLGDTVDYRGAYEAARSVVEGEPRRLLESVAGEIARRVLELPRVERVRVRISKRPPLPGEVRTFAVELVRERA